MSKLKITGFGRLVIFLLIIAPIVYFGMKYLQSNGTLDKMKDKVEDIQSDRNGEIEIESSEDILKDIDRRSGNQVDNGQDAVIAEQQRKIDELERKNRELQNRNAENSTTKVPPIKIPEPNLGSPSTSNNTNGAPSIDDLIRGAENSSGRATSPDLSPPSTTSAEALAAWTFSLSGTSGTIEFFEQNGQLISRATYMGRDQVDVQEMVQRNDRLYVTGSPTDEYYILREDGDLDAYDKSGFLVRCRRK